MRLCEKMYVWIISVLQVIFTLPNCVDIVSTISSTLVDRFLQIFNLYYFHPRWWLTWRNFVVLFAARNEFYVIYLFNKQPTEEQALNVNREFYRERVAERLIILLTMSEYEREWPLIFFCSIMYRLIRFNKQWIDRKSVV